MKQLPDYMKIFFLQFTTLIDSEMAYGILKEQGLDKLLNLKNSVILLFDLIFPWFTLFKLI